MRNDFCLIGAKHMEVTGNTAPGVSWGVSQAANTVSTFIWFWISLVCIRNRLFQVGPKWSVQRNESGRSCKETIFYIGQFWIHKSFDFNVKGPNDRSVS